MGMQEWEVSHEIGNDLARANARIVYLQRRLFECESAMLMGHAAGKVQYMEQYPDPIDLPR